MKKIGLQNLNEDLDGEEDFEETWETVKIGKLIKLSEIKDFDELDMCIYQLK